MTRRELFEAWTEAKAEFKRYQEEVFAKDRYNDRFCRELQARWLRVVETYSELWNYSPFEA